MSSTATGTDNTLVTVTDARVCASAMGESSGR